MIAPKASAEGISGSRPLPHISTVYYLGDELVLIPREEEVKVEEALALLLNEPGITLGQDTLVPCFDLEELKRRNQRKEK